MAMAKAPEDNIYQGVWINWLNGGKVFGLTLTVSPNMASVLSPALALIVSIAGSQLWRLFQFALHQSRATHRQKNFLYHQQQVTLRNTATDLNTFWRLLRLAFAWRRHTDIKVFWESFPLLLWTFIHLTLVVLVGLFSSWLLHANDHVLSRSPWCGVYQQDFLNDLDVTNFSNVPILTNTFKYTNHRNYWFQIAQRTVDICTTSPKGCTSLPVTSLPYTKTIDPGTCPFASSICHPKGDTIEFDTGPISSAAHLGFNAPDHDRVSFRLQAKCAPLDDAKYVTGWQLVDATSELPAHQVSDAHYGPSSDSVRNATFSMTKEVMECKQRAALPPYALKAQLSCPGNNASSNFDPIPELQVSDGDTNLIMLMVNILYHNPVVDPWFTAQNAVNTTNAFCIGMNETLYERETPLTTIGCTQQWQFCNSDSQKGGNSTQCTPLQGIEQTRNAFRNSAELQSLYSPRQMATILQILRALSGANLQYIIYALGQQNTLPIKARDFVRTGTVGLSLPDNQWQTETEYWMQILLAYIQQNSINLVSGQFAFDTQYINVTTPKTDTAGSAYWLCQNQIIHSATFRNFNFFALLFCVILCLVITILGLTIEDIIGYVRQRNSHNSKHHGKKDMWFENSDLEMLRTISELKNKLRWSRSSFGIPFAPVGAKATTDDLRSDESGWKDGHRMIDTIFRRQRTTTTVASSPEKRRAHVYEAHYGEKSCTTCESFEMVSAGSDGPNSKITHNEPAVYQSGQAEEFYYANAIPTHKSHLDSQLPQAHGQSAVLSTDNLPRTDTQLLQQSQREHRNGYDIIHPNTSIGPGVNDVARPFHYSHDLSQSKNSSTNSIDQRHDQGTPMLGFDNFSIDNQNHVTISWRGTNEQNWVDHSDTEREEQVSRHGGVWPWSRRQDNTGTIC